VVPGEFAVEFAATLAAAIVADAVDARGLRVKAPRQAGIASDQVDRDIAAPGLAETGTNLSKSRAIRFRPGEWLGQKAAGR